MTKKRFIILGATGSVGRELLSIFEEKGHAPEEVRLLASKRSEGQKILFAGYELSVENAESFLFSNHDMVFSALESDVARRLIPQALSKGAFVIDKSAVFRMDPSIPLIVPEVNRSCIRKETSLVCTPNCVAIPLVMVLNQLNNLCPLSWVTLSTYQAVSGAGERGVKTLHAESQGIYAEGASPFPHPIHQNVIPQIGPFNEDGTSDEEQKIIEETRKVLNLPHLPISVTSVRVPVVRGHSLSLTLAFSGKMPSVSKVFEAFQKASGFSVSMPESYATPLDAAKKDTVFISRIRENPAMPDTISMWVVCDNLRKGAALNAYHIAESISAEKIL